MPSSKIAASLNPRLIQSGVQGYSRHVRPHHAIQVPVKSAICVYARNERRHIQEWIAYHAALGFSSIILYDNGSDDGTTNAAQEMAAVCDMIVVPWSHATSNQAQFECYADCLSRFGAQYDWIAFIDADEFIASPADVRIQSLIAANASASAISLNWAIFGSSGHEVMPGGLVIEEFVTRSDQNFEVNKHTKMIVRPTRVTKMWNPHFFEVDGLTVTPDGSQANWDSEGLSATLDFKSWRVNHYFVRSKEHWKEKINRGYRDITRQDTDFAHYDRNEVVDFSAQRLSQPVRSMLRVVARAG